VEDHRNPRRRGGEASSHCRPDHAAAHDDHIDRRTVKMVERARQPFTHQGEQFSIDVRLICNFCSLNDRSIRKVAI
jgi:hypothetical protein